MAGELKSEGECWMESESCITERVCRKEGFDEGGRMAIRNRQGISAGGESDGGRMGEWEGGGKV